MGAIIQSSKTVLHKLVCSYWEHCKRGKQRTSRVDTNALILELVSCSPALPWLTVRISLCYRGEQMDYTECVGSRSQWNHHHKDNTVPIAYCAFWIQQLWWREKTDMVHNVSSEARLVGLISSLPLGQVTWFFPQFTHLKMSDSISHLIRYGEDYMHEYIKSAYNDHCMYY